MAGERIRELVLDPAAVGLSARTEVLLMLAARAQHVSEVIGPALAAGRHVVCDRFSASTVAYQGYGRGLDPHELARLSEWATNGLKPDRVVLLRVDQRTARGRLAVRGEGTGWSSRRRRSSPGSIRGSTLWRRQTRTVGASSTARGGSMMSRRRCCLRRVFPCRSKLAQHNQNSLPGPASGDTLTTPAPRRGNLEGAKASKPGPLGAGV